MKTRRFCAAAIVAIVSIICLCSFSSQSNVYVGLNKEVHTHNHAQGWGKCSWSGCKCPGFKVGGASGAKCSNCGHMDFNHK